MKHKLFKSLIALLIAGLLLLAGCDKTPSEVSEGDMPQSDINSNISDEYTSGEGESGEELSGGAEESGDVEESGVEESGVEESGVEESGEESVAESSEIEESSEEASVEQSEEPSEEQSEEPPEPSWPTGTSAYDLYDTGYVCVKYNNSKRAALADSSGRMLTKFEYTDISALSGRYIAFVKGSRHMTITDLELNVVFEGDFSEGHSVITRDYIRLKGTKSKLYSLYSIDLKKYDIPEFEYIDFFALGDIEVAYVEFGDGTSCWYKFDGDKSSATVYDMKSAVEENYERVIKPLRQFYVALKADDFAGMRKYAVPNVVDSYEAYLKNPDPDNKLGKAVSDMKVREVTGWKYHDMLPGLLYVEDKAAERYFCTFWTMPLADDETLLGCDRSVLFNSYFSTVPDGKGGLLIDSFVIESFPK